MQTKIVIRDFEPTENLQNYLQDKIEDTIYPFLQQFPNAEAQVTVHEDRHRTENRRPHFECIVLLKIPNSKSIIRVERSGDHFYTCVHDVCETLTQVLGRKHRRLASMQARRKVKISDLPVIDLVNTQADAI